MIPAERQRFIVEELSGRGIVSIAHLVDKLGVSHMTVRRDIRHLERDGRLASVAGGAQLVERTLSREAPHRAKIELHRAEKAAIARQCAAMVPKGALIYLDAGTTTLALAEALSGRDDLTVVTNDFSILDALLSRTACVLHHTGGAVDRENLSAIGDGAAQAIRRFNFDLAFISSSSFSARGLSVTAEGKGVVKAAAVDSAARAILAVDSSKYGRRAPYASVNLRRFHAIVSDPGLASGARRGLDAAGVEIHIADFAI